MLHNSNFWSDGIKTLRAANQKVIAWTDSVIVHVIG